MGNHPFNVVVVLFWLATMSWLVVAKVLPPMRVGEPPSYRTILEQGASPSAACWTVELSDRTIGWAANKLVRRPDGITELDSRVYLRDLPLDELAPGWLHTVLKPVLRDLGPLNVDKRSRIVVDPLGRLVGFESRVRIADIPDAIKVQGQIEGSALKLTAQSGEIPYKVECYLPPDALMTDELSPQAIMPGLRVGQTWTVPLYSPFRPASSPIEILQARVERADRITWWGRSLNSRVIEFRSDPGSGLVGKETRGRMWVGEDGVVLRHEVTILRSRLQFIRLPDEQAETLTAALGEDWTGPLDDETARQLLETTSRHSP